MRILRVLIIGGDSVIGRAISNFWDGDLSVDCHSSTRSREETSRKRPYINLKKIETFKLEKSYDSVIICAGITNIDYCENNPVETFQINVTNTIKLANYFSLRGSLIFFLSTNLVFDGFTPYKKPLDKKSPYNEYGNQKSYVEDNIIKLNKFVILRLTKVVHKNLSIHNKWLNELKLGKKIYAFNDMNISPVKLDTVVSIITDNILPKNNMIIHCSGLEDISYYLYAQKFACKNGYAKNRVISISSNDYIDKSPPLFSSLDNSLVQLSRRC